VLSLSLSLPAGSAYDPAGREGLAIMMATLLTKGADDRSAEQIAEAIESVGGSIGASAGADFVTVGVGALASDAALAFDLLGDVVVRPTFPESELSLARTQALSALQLEQSQPASIADRMFMRALYGKHPYARRSVPASVQAITRDDLTRFHAARVRPQGALLVVAGDITLERARELATAAFRGWTGATPVTTAFATPAAPARTEILLVHRPGSVQSNILLGNLTSRPGAATWYGAQVANKVLGGGADARLFLTLREAKGWTYGAYSRLERPKDVGSFVASAEVRTEVTDSALAELLAQVRRVRTEPIPAAELDAAKGALVGTFPLSIETAEQVASQVSMVRLLGLPTDYLATYRPRLAAVTAAQATAAAQATIKPQAMTVVVVGDATKIHAGLQKIAPVRIVSVEGTPMTVADLTPKATALAADASKLVARRDSFALLVQGNPFGSMTTALEKTATGWRYTENTVLGPVGRTQSEVSFDAALVMTSAKGTGTMQGQALNTDVSYAGGKATGSASAPGAGGIKTTTVDAAVAPGTIDDDMLTALLPTFGWSPTARHTVSLFDASKNTSMAATLAVTGSEQVTVPAGTFAAYKVSLTGTEAPRTMWITTAAPHRLLKVAIAGAPVELVLVK
jgi:zinc protease